jgi:hypothetical protein
MHAHQFFARHGEHIEGIIVAQIRLHREREFGEVGKLPEVGRMHARLVKGALIVADIVVGVFQRPSEASCLQRHHLVARGALGVVEFGAIGIALRFQACRSHGAFP